MSSSASSYDVVIVGGGAIGCFAARELAPDHDVLLLEKGQIAGEASGLAGGTIASSLFFDWHPDAAHHANDFFRAFDGTDEFVFTQRPRLEFIDPADEEGARERAETMHHAGIPASFVDAATATDRYPEFDLSGFAGVIELRDSGRVDPYTYTTTLARDAERRGAEIRTNVGVNEIHTDGNHVTGVSTDNEHIDAPTVVVATGWQTPALLEDLVPVPVRPYRTQCVILDPGSPLPDEFPVGRRVDEKIYFCPEGNGNLLVGGGSSGIDDPWTASRSEDESFREQVARVIPQFIDGFEQARFVDGWAGIAGMAADGRPIVDAPGRWSEECVDGLVVAQASVLGIMGSPIIGTAVRCLVTDEAAPFDLSPFALSRFESVDQDFEVHSVSSGHYS